MNLGKAITEQRTEDLIWYPGALSMGAKGILSLSKWIPKKRRPGLPPSPSSSLFIMAHYGTTGTVSVLQSLCQSQLRSANVTVWNICFLTLAVNGCPFLPRSGRSWQAHQRLQKISAFQLAKSSVLSCTQFVTRGMLCNVAQSSYKALAAISFTKKKKKSSFSAAVHQWSATQNTSFNVSQWKVFFSPIFLVYIFHLWEARPVNSIMYF